MFTLKFQGSKEQFAPNEILFVSQTVVTNTKETYANFRGDTLLFDATLRPPRSGEGTYSFPLSVRGYVRTYVRHHTL